MLGECRAPLVVNIDVDARGKPEKERMLLEFLRVQADAHRQALHDFDPVARGVLRRQHRKRAAGACREAEHLAVIAHVRPVHVS